MNVNLEKIRITKEDYLYKIISLDGNFQNKEIKIVEYKNKPYIVVKNENNEYKAIDKCPITDKKIEIKIIKESDKRMEFQEMNKSLLLYKKGKMNLKDVQEKIKNLSENIIDSVEYIY